MTWSYAEINDTQNGILEGWKLMRFLLIAWSLISIWLAAPISFAAPTRNAIASAHPLATQAGFEILEQGGNAFDASVAVSAALAVVEPTGSGLGGGGFWLLYRARDGKSTMLDGRERAPFSAKRDMYLDSEGHFDQNRSINGPLAAGIPGMPAAIVYLAKHYGKLPLRTSLAPAIRLAREGFRVGTHYMSLLAFRSRVMKNFPASAAIFLPKQAVSKAKFRLIQKDLAHTLEQIARHGRAGFYSGPVAKALVHGVHNAGGIWTLRDLAEYRVLEREPVRSQYQDIEITSAAPPSSGGVVLVEALNILSRFNLNQIDDIDRTHLVVEAMRRAYRDRARYLGDPDFVSMPIAKLISPEYAALLRLDLRVDQAGFAAPVGKSKPETVNEGEDTTHFSILDKAGNRVAATLSINYPFGSGFVPPGTGVLLNDEMDDFVSQDKGGNIYGLVGGEANRIEPGKRMLSSMTPTFLEDSDRVAILGTPGGSRIISMVLLAVLDFARGHPVDSWVRIPRYHHQYLPDQIQYESEAFDSSEIESLKKRGHELQELSRRYGNMQALLWDKRSNRVTAASDPRVEGEAMVR